MQHIFLIGLACLIFFLIELIDLSAQAYKVRKSELRIKK